MTIDVSSNRGRVGLDGPVADGISRNLQRVRRQRSLEYCEKHLHQTGPRCIRRAGKEDHLDYTERQRMQIQPQKGMLYTGQA